MDNREKERLQLRNACGRFLRYGYTSGSCAAAAAKASAIMLLSKEDCREICLQTPKGILLTLPIYDIKRDAWQASCAVQKDAGDDADITNGMFVYAGVSYLPKEEKGIRIQGGIGVGRVTKPGLDQPPGEWAINSGPRGQIARAVAEAASAYGYKGGLLVTIWIPKGEELAAKTFNPKLGIVGGLSIIGTSGIVEPMSEEALVAAVQLEIHVKAAEGKQYLILAPGNYGQDFIQQELGLSLEGAVKCSNFIGDALAKAWDEPFEGILLAGHIGKLVKLGAGRLNTHSRHGDGRMEELACCMELAGYRKKDNPVLECTTTEDALSVLKGLNLYRQVMEILMGRIMGTVQEHFIRMGHKNSCNVEIIVFSKQHGIVGETEKAREYVRRYRLEEE